MSNFSNLTPMVQGGSNSRGYPNVFSACTTDSQGTIEGTGYLDDIQSKGQIFQPYDLVLINIINSSNVIQSQAWYQVTFSASHWSLILYPASGYLLAANNLSDVASLSTSLANLNAAVGGLVYFDVTVGEAALASGGSVTLVTSSAAMQFKVRNLWANKVGTNFSGGGGDRLLQITDGTTVYSVIPATNIQTLVNSGWGISTPLPFPASASINTSTAAGASLVAKYSGGTTDYTAGSIVLTGVAQRVA